MSAGKTIGRGPLIDALGLRGSWKRRFEQLDALGIKPIIQFKEGDRERALYDWDESMALIARINPPKPTPVVPERIVDDAEASRDATLTALKGYTCALGERTAGNEVAIQHLDSSVRTLIIGVNRPLRAAGLQEVKA